MTLAKDLIYGICREGKTSNKALATYVSGLSSKESKERRIERFYEHTYVDRETFLESIRNIFSSAKFVLSLDRTNWKFGSTYINIFAAFAQNGNEASLINLKMLDNKGGNSKSKDRIDLCQEVINQYGKNSISMLLGDREFFSIEFANYLIDNNIPFAIRLRENLDFVQPYLTRAMKPGRTIKNIVISRDEGRVLMCDLSIKKLKNEWLIIACKDVKNPLKSYRKRWAIECFFKMLKTGGLNLESTKITKSNRLEILILMCSIAYLICSKLGAYIHEKIKSIRWKATTKCYEYSFFRYGMDWLKDRFFNKIEQAIYLLSQVIGDF